MEFSKAQLDQLWKGMKMPLTRDQRITKLMVIRNGMNVIDRGVRRLWDFFEEENWKRSSHEVEELHARVTTVRDLILEMAKEDGESEDHGSGGSAGSSHSGEPAP